MSERSERMEITSTDLLACPFCGQTPDKIEHDHLGAFVWHQSAWCPIAAPFKMAPDVWQRREKANKRITGNRISSHDAGYAEEAPETAP